MEINDINPTSKYTSNLTPKKETSTFLQYLALIMLFIGAIGSLGFMYHGRHNNSFLLVGLFTIWVLSPFIILLIANIAFKSWSYLTRVTIYILILFISLISLVSYSGILGYNHMKPAFIYLFVPFVSWMLIVIVLSTALLSIRRSKRNNVV